MKASSAAIHLCSAADAAYLAPLAAMVRSAMGHTRSCAVTLHVFSEGIGETERRRLLASWPFENLTVRWLRPRCGVLAGVPVPGRLGMASYWRLLVGTALPDAISRTLWLDSDLIVLRDLAALWNTPLDGKLIGAAQDLTVPYVSSARGLRHYRRLGLTGREPYFNSGVMVIDLDQWRRQRVSDRVLGYLRSFAREVYYHDQDGLNAVLAGRWKPLDPRWNLIECVAGQPFFHPEHLRADEYRSLVADPWIVHYAGPWKPWTHASSRPTRRLFFDYLDRTEWAGWGRPRTLRARLMKLYESRIRRYTHRFENPALQMAARVRSLARRRFKPRG